jgi:hypothetical protein
MRVIHLAPRQFTPDWLDLSCLRKPVAEDEAKLIAEKAVASLTKVAAFAHSEQTKAVRRAIEHQGSSNEINSVFVSRIWRLSGGVAESYPDESDDESLVESYSASLETLLKVETGSFNGMFRPYMFEISVEGQDTFLPSSAQRISGKAVALRGAGRARTDILRVSRNWRLGTAIDRFSLEFLHICLCKRSKLPSGADPGNVLTDRTLEISVRVQH